jgi:hypothetical protein
MASVVRLATIVAQERHGIVLRNVFWVLPDEVCENGRDADMNWQCEYTKAFRALTFDRVPEGGNGLDVLVQGDCEAINLVLVLHDKEWIVR